MYLEHYTHIKVPFYVYNMRAARLNKLKFYAVYGWIRHNAESNTDAVFEKRGRRFRRGSP